MTALEARKLVQHALGVSEDGQLGKRSLEAFTALAGALDTSAWPPVAPVVSAGWHNVKASSFADPADVRAFKKCKERGNSDQECFKVGDNGVGCWGDDVSEGTGPACALPPEDMEERWGSIANAKHKTVEVSANGKTTTVVLKDRMPHRANIKNGAGIDLNPTAVRALGLEPPIMIMAVWRWV